MFGVACVSLFAFEPHGDVGLKLYRLLGLFSHDSAWVFEAGAGTKNLPIRVLAVSAPIVSVLAALALFYDWLLPLWVACRARGRLLFGQRRCIALIGLSEQSFALAVSLANDASHETMPIVLACDPDPKLAILCAHAGIAVFSRHAWDFSPRLLWRPMKIAVFRVHPLLNRAWGLISFLPTADAQLEFIAELQSWQPVVPGARSRAWILLDDRGLAQRLEDHVERLFLTDKKGIKPVVPRLLTLNMLRARHLLASRQFDTLADAFGQGQIHIAIYGLGATGRAIAKEAAQYYVTRPSLASVKLRVTFFDRDPVAAEAAFLAEDPGISSVIDLTGCEIDFSTAGLLESQFCFLPANVTAHVIAFGDAASAFNLAVSLRRWLLEPPVKLDSAQSRPATPIFVRTPSWRGLGQLFCKRPDAFSMVVGEHDTFGAAIPDGIFGYGAVEDLFGAADRGLAPTAAFLDEDGEQGAKKLHQSYENGRPGVTGSSDAGEQRVAERKWAELPSSLRDSNFRAYDHIAVKARAIGWRFVQAHSGPHHRVAIKDDDASELAELEHRRYMAERIANGWRYAAQRLDAVRVHPDLVDWSMLDKAEQQLDRLQIDSLADVAIAARRRLAPSFVIGIVGQRAKGWGEDKPLIAGQLKRLQKQHRGSEILLLTSLAPGPEAWAAEAALELQIPFVAVLPLPYELYKEDFVSSNGSGHFRFLASKAELHLELPLRFGRASELTMSRQPAPEQNLGRRNKQYALAKAYIVERAHALIAVYDGGPPANVGDAADAVSWWKSEVPAEFATPSNFFVRPPHPRLSPYVIGRLPSQDAPRRPDAGHH